MYSQHIRKSELILFHASINLVEIKLTKLLCFKVIFIFIKIKVGMVLLRYTVTLVVYNMVTICSKH